MSPSVLAKIPACLYGITALFRVRVGETFTSEFFHESNVEHIEITPISWTSEFQKQKRNNVICVHK